MSSYQRYDEDTASLYGSNSPVATERTRLTSSSNSSSSKGGGAGVAGGGGGASGGGRGGGGSLSVNILRGGLTGPAASSTSTLESEPDLRRQTTVRLLMGGGPEVTF